MTLFTAASWFWFAAYIRAAAKPQLKLRFFLQLEASHPAPYRTQIFVDWNLFLTQCLIIRAFDNTVLNNAD